LILREQEDEGEAREGKKRKPRKWTVNKLAGRLLRCEFAEDPALRYRKRFGKKREGADEAGDDAAAESVPLPVSVEDGPPKIDSRPAPASRKKQSSAHERRRAKRKTEQAQT